MVSRSDLRCDAHIVMPAVIIQAALMAYSPSSNAQPAQVPVSHAPTQAPASKGSAQAPVSNGPTQAPASKGSAQAPMSNASVSVSPTGTHTASDSGDTLDSGGDPGDAHTSPSASPDAASGVDGIDLDDLEIVTVTVDRRKKSLQEYGGSASAYTPTDMQRTGVHSLRTMSDVSPYVHIGVQEGNTEVYIRGVGNDNNTELGDPAAATHIDGVYIPRPRGVGAMYFDLERVEVGRGPQGTLRGRNATAGSINIITAKPKLQDWAGQASLQLGNYSQRLTQTMVNIPLGDAMALRLASFTENHDPFYSNAGPIQTIKATESADTLAYRAGFRWEPTKKVTILLSHDYMQEKGTGYGGTNFFPALNAGLMPGEIRDPRKVIYRGPQGKEDSWHWGAHADVVMDLGPLSVQYLGSFRSLRYQQTTPGATGVWYPGMPDPTSQLDNWSHSVWDSRSQSTVQELRIFAPDSARFRWTLGGFAFYEAQQTLFAQIQDQSNNFSGNEFTMPDVKGSSYAGFGDATFDITKALRVTGGIRFTSEEKSRRGIGNSYNFATPTNFRFGTEGFAYAGLDRGDTSNLGNPLDVWMGGIKQFGVRDTLPGMVAALGPDAAKGINLQIQDGHYNDTFVDWRVGLEYNLGPSHMVYATASTGHHSGGFNDNITLTNGSSIAKTYRPESVYAIEIGSKNEFLNRKARLNISAFDYEYQDMQFQTVIATGPVPPNGGTPPSAAVRDNVTKARVLGAEIGAQYQAPFGLTASVDALVLDSHFIGDSKVRDGRLSYNLDPATQMVPLDGKWLPKSSRLTLNYSLSQTFATSIGYFDWVASAQTRTKYYLTVFNGEGRDMAGNENAGLQDAVDTYTRIDLGVGHTRPDGKLRFEGFVNNLTDIWYTTSLVNVPNLNLRFVNPPRQFGVRVTVYM